MTLSSPVSTKKRCRRVPSWAKINAVGREAALRAWLFSQRAFRGIALESETEVIGLPASVFVLPEFMSAEVEDPRPCVNSRVIAALAQGRPVLLPDDRVGACNATAGIDVVNILGSWRDRAWTSDEMSQITALLAESFLECHRGYRMRRLLREAPNARELRMVRASGAFRLLATFPESAIAFLTKEDTLAVPFSVLRLVFRYQRPVLRLGECDQQLLLAALRGRTDAELGVELGLSVAAVKRRWLSIYARISTSRPVVRPRAPRGAQALRLERRVAGTQDGDPALVDPVAGHRGVLEG
jgi:hypothetical protein